MSSGYLLVSPEEELLHLNTQNRFIYHLLLHMLDACRQNAYFHMLVES